MSGQSFQYAVEAYRVRGGVSGQVIYDVALTCASPRWVRHVIGNHEESLSWVHVGLYWV